MVQTNQNKGKNNSQRYVRGIKAMTALTVICSSAEATFILYRLFAYFVDPGADPGMGITVVIVLLAVAICLSLLFRHIFSKKLKEKEAKE